MEKENENLPFAKRYGFEPINIPYQFDNINKTLRTELWNAFYIYIHLSLEDADRYQKSSYRTLYQALWIHYFKKAFDDYPRYDSEFASFVRIYIEKGVWYKIYEFFEFVLDNLDDRLYKKNDFIAYLKIKLSTNNSSYTIINNKFFPITNESEINELKQTQKLSKRYNLKGIQEHLNSAIELLSQKPNPDLRNSIKESISMVEVISRIIEPTENTLGKALKKLEKHKKINSTLKSGFEKLYAYANDKNGIRHALMDEQSLEIEDAKFFLISCSAFTNYLIEKALKDNLLSDIED